ncbi:MAG: protein kinase [Actinophytocola sp.]|uniref:serine/threonine-protein kinase n=1 Tax=Actinophytocola sp. TaxID=1872138 RepID=UPI00132471A9|nr:serine/threonine-protein kinase [Actinophytocola sp.]MPZ83783.1 protein kinase [Actinophytocola sp.]
MEPGELVAGRYRLESLVGRGAMGIVWLAKDERLDRQVAVKQLLLEAASVGSSGDAESSAEADEVTARAMREARIAGRLRHPNAIAVHDVVEHDGRPCLVLEYLLSDSLAAVLAARGGLPPQEVAGIGAQVAAALADAHAAGVVHRDVKPDNVLITADGTAKITDFGISRATGDGTVTAAGIIAGTPAYLAPEVAGGGDADFRSDVFSLGATLYAALEGSPPFGLDENPIALLHRVAAGEITPPRRSGPLTGTLLWLLRREPDERPTMRAAHEVLAAAAAGRPVPEFQPPSPTLVLPTRRWSPRAVLAGVAAVALVAAGGVLGLLINDPESTGTPGAATTSTSDTPPPPDEPACSARFEVGNSWQAGYEAKVTIRNEGDEPLSGWSLTWPMPDGHEINNMWGGTVEQDGNTVTVSNADWNVTVPVSGTISIGMTVDAPEGDRPSPTVRCQEK